MSSSELPRLAAATSASAAGPSGTGIVHLGLGSFHRAHQAVYTRAAFDAEGGDWGILGVASRSAAVVDALHAQDMRYTVLEISPEGSTCSTPDVHTGALIAAREPERVTAAIGDAATRIVSLTVTEHGYTYHPAHQGLAFDHPDIRHDLAASGPPRSTIGQLVGGLRRRMGSHGEPVTIMSCDNLSDNGRLTGRLVREFAANLSGAEGSELVAWIDANVTFPTTMVDRIVPATTDQHREQVARLCGHRDEVPVPAEPFTMWVLEDSFAAGRPAWEAGGAIFSTEVAKYEQLKVRLLNGTHSLIAYLGALSGAATIPESTGSDFIASAAHRVLRTEYLPSVDLPDGVDVDDYERQLFTRWRNSALGHRTSQVGSDGSVKLRERIPQPALVQRAAGRTPHLLALTFAGYLSCVAPLPGFEPGEHAAAMRDPVRSRLAPMAAASANGRELARRALVEARMLGDDIADWDVFVERVGELVDAIHRHGVAFATAEASTETESV
jgi:fructuronate reductase